MNERLGQAQLTQAHQADSRADEAKKFGLMQLLEAQKEARRRKEHLSDTYSQRQWQDKRDELHRANELKAAGILAGQKAAEKREVDVEKDVENLSKRLESAPGMRRDMTTLVEGAKKDDIPGVGPWAGRLPDFLVSGEGLKVRQAARGVVRNTIHETSGTAASEGEVERIMGELGLKENASEDAYRLGLEGLADKTRALLRAKEAGYRPEAVQVARQRGMVTSEDIPTYKVGDKTGAPQRPRRTIGNETRVWDGSNWVKE